MTPEEQRQVRKIILHSRIGCIVVKMSELFRISPTDALDVFYRSNTCRRFHDEKTGLYLYGDLYIIDELEIELLSSNGNSELRDVLFQSFDSDQLRFKVNRFKRFMEGASFLDHRSASIQSA